MARKKSARLGIQVQSKTVRVPLEAKYLLHPASYTGTETWSPSQSSDSRAWEKEDVWIQKNISKSFQINIFNIS